MPNQAKQQKGEIMETILIQKANIWDGEHFMQADVLLGQGQILAMNPGLEAPGARCLNAEGCVLAPGFTDLHVHLRQPGYEEKETVATGTAAALAGGFTTVCAMPNLRPVPDSPAHLEEQTAVIRREARCRVLPYGAITVGEQGEELAQIEALAGQVAGFSDDGRGVQSEEMMRRAMRLVEKKGSFVAAHCEVDSLLPAGGVCVQENCRFTEQYGYTGFSCESESAEVERNIRLCEETGCRLHICHTSAAQSFALVRQAKKKGLPVSCEVAPHHLLLSCEDIPADDGNYKMNPPLRRKEDVQAAIEALLDGTVDAIATDHAPHTAADKAGGFAKAACGIPGLETAFPLLYTAFVETGKLPLEQLLRLFTQGPKRVLGERQQFPAAGRKADFTLLRLPEGRRVEPGRFQTKARGTPFAGQVLKGWPLLTVWGEERFTWPGAL